MRYKYKALKPVAHAKRAPQVLVLVFYKAFLKYIFNKISKLNSVS
jgi:hypothetical protein